MGVYKVISRILVCEYVGLNVRLNKVWTCWLFNQSWLTAVCYKSSFIILSLYNWGVTFFYVTVEILFIKKLDLHFVIFVI